VGQDRTIERNRIRSQNARTDVERTNGVMVMNEGMNTKLTDGPFENKGETISLELKSHGADQVTKNYSTSSA